MDRSAVTDVPPPTPPVLVIDIGGTKLAAGVMMPDNTVRDRLETPTLAQEGAQAILGRVVCLAQAVVADYGRQAQPDVAAVGVASAGQIDPRQGNVVFATDNLPGWSGLRLGELLAQALHLPVYVGNDVNCFALAEAELGAGQGCQHLLLVAVGTGVGGGIVVDGRLYSGFLGRSGEVGHMCVVPVDGRPCTCGLYGCLEAYAATRVILANGGYGSIQALAADYRLGVGIPAVEEAAMWLGRGLASLAHILGPAAILVGGSVGLLGGRYLESVRQAFVPVAMVPYRSIPILPTQLGADSGLLGAGVLARHGHWVSP